MSHKSKPIPTRCASSQPVTPVIVGTLSLLGLDRHADAVNARADIGMQRYGTELTTHNGLNAASEAREELYDLAQYVTQAILEDSPDSLSIITDIVEIAGVLLHLKNQREVMKRCETKHLTHTQH